jgi:hypothetical protein
LIAEERLKQASQHPRTNAAARPIGVRNIQPGMTHAGAVEEAVRDAYASIRDSAHSLHSNSTAHQTPGHQTGLTNGGLIADTVTGLYANRWAARRRDAAVAPRSPAAT